MAESARYFKELATADAKGKAALDLLPELERLLIEGWRTHGDPCTSHECDFGRRVQAALAKVREVLGDT